MIARLHDHAADSAPDDPANHAADETAQETVASVSDGLVKGGDRDDYRGGRQEFAQCDGTLRRIDAHGELPMAR